MNTFLLNNMSDQITWKKENRQTDLFIYYHYRHTVFESGNNSLMLELNSRMTLYYLLAIIWGVSSR